MKRIEVSCPICKLKFWIPEFLSGFSYITCYKRGGHAVAFDVDEKKLDRKTAITIEQAMKDVEEKLKH